MAMYQLLFLLLMLHSSTGNTLGPIKETRKTIEDVYDKNLFEIAKLYFKVDENKISNLFHYNADLINYLEKHSYLEVIWCFHLSKEMTLKKTFERIKSMESQNKFTIYSATGSKPWPSGKNEPRHNVCDTISKQPITSGLYENFLVPARCKALGINPVEFNKVKNFFDIEQYATRLEFAQALHIDIVAKRIQPKISEAIIERLNKITFLLIKKQTNKNKNELASQSIVTLLSSSYKLAKHALTVTLKYYTNKPKIIRLLENASFKSVTHLIKNPRPENMSFGEILEHLELAIIDLKKNLNTPIIIALDRNHVISNIINKTLMNAFITIIKEPSDIIASFYKLSQEQKKFIEATKISTFYHLISESKIRLEHFSINYLIELIVRQSPANLKQSKIIHNSIDTNNAYVESVRSILKRTTLGDFLRIYHKSWTKAQLMKKTLSKLAVHQGMTGNEFLKVYGLEKTNISKIALFTNYTLQMLQNKRKHIYYLTLDEIGEFIKKDISDISVTMETNHDEDDVSTDKKDVVTKTTSRIQKIEMPNKKRNEVLRPKDARVGNGSEKRSKGTRPLLVIAPTMLCVFASIASLAGWVYYERRKAWRSAW